MLMDTTDNVLAQMREVALGTILKPHDNHLGYNFPSTLFVEVALLTSDNNLLLLRKSRARSALAKIGRVWTCTIEERVLWDDVGEEIHFDDTVLKGLKRELELEPN